MRVSYWVLGLLALSGCKDFIDPKEVYAGYWAQESLPLLLVADTEDLNELFGVQGAWFNEVTGVFIFTDDLLAAGRIVPVIEGLGFNSGEAARTVRQRSGPDPEVITDGAIHVNASYWRDLSDTQRIRAIRHELGHLLGLGHINDEKSIMFPSLNSRATFMDLSEGNLTEGERILLRANYLTR